MLTYVQVTAHVVWDEVLWGVRALYQESPTEQPTVLHKDGRAPLGDDDSPEGVLHAVVAALATGDFLEDEELLSIALASGDSSRADS